MSGEAGGVVVTVEIFGRRYPIRSSLDAAYVSELATYVDQKMQTASDSTSGGDSVRIAVLAALNIADEFYRYRQSGGRTSSNITHITLELEQLVDRALADSPTSSDAS